ncbi:12534_t:CDS:2, partial [Racocetra persica]
IRGLIPAMILEKLEEEVSKRRGKDVRIADMFDIVAGTSTGSIISLGLTVSDGAENPRPKYRASDLVKLYNEEGEKFFGPVSRWSWVRWLNKLSEEPEPEDKTKQKPAVDIFYPTYFREQTEILGP